MPKRIYISTHLRMVTPTGENSGEYGHIYVLDWETKKLLVDPRGHTPDYSLGTPMGKSHGCRGITFHNGILYVASSDHKLSKYDIDTLEYIDTIEFHPEIAYLHQIRDHDGILHCISTGRDSIVRIQNDKIIEISSLENPELEKIFPEKGPQKKWGDGRIHCNSINWAPNGDEYHVYMTCNTIYNYTQKKAISIDKLRSPHDVVFLDDKRLLTSSSATRETLEINIKTKKVKIIQTRNKRLDPGSHIPADIVMHGFTRGIAVATETIFACSNPTTITMFNRDYKQLEEFELGTDPREIIYDIILDPRDWSI